jgi:hypothetical protein
MKKRNPAKTKRKGGKRAFTEAQFRTLHEIVKDAIGLHELEHHTTTVLIQEPSVFISEDPIKDEVEEARAKLAAGFDLTPEEFPLPPGHSYFGRTDDGETPLVPGFIEHYFEELQKHQNQKKAYIATCSFFGFPDYETPS